MARAHYSPLCILRNTTEYDPQMSSFLGLRQRIFLNSLPVVQIVAAEPFETSERACSALEAHRSQARAFLHRCTVAFPRQINLASASRKRSALQG